LKLQVKVQMDVEQVTREIAALGDAGEEAAKEVLNAFAVRVVNEAKPLTPVEPIDGGDLRESVRAISARKGRTGVLGVTVMAGGAPLKAKLEATKHRYNVVAAVQHEDMSLKHTSGGPKFIERPFLRAVVQVPNELLAALDARKP